MDKGGDVVKKPIIWVMGSSSLVFVFMVTQLLFPITVQEFIAIFTVSAVLGIVPGVLASILHQFITTKKKNKTNSHRS